MGLNFPSFFFTKKKGLAIGLLLGLIQFVSRFSFKNSSSWVCSSLESGYILQSNAFAPSTNSIAWSHGHRGGSLSNVCFSNTSRYG